MCLVNPLWLLIELFCFSNSSKKRHMMQLMHKQMQAFPCLNALSKKISSTICFHFWKPTVLGCSDNWHSFFRSLWIHCCIFFNWQWRMIIEKKKKKKKHCYSTLTMPPETIGCHPKHVEWHSFFFLLNLHVNACIWAFFLFFFLCQNILLLFVSLYYLFFQEFYVVIGCTCISVWVSSVYLGHFHSLHYCHAATPFTAGQVNFWVNFHPNRWQVSQFA